MGQNVRVVGEKDDHKRGSRLIASTSLLFELAT